MSIASEISRLQQAKSDLATSITNKGVTVPAATTIDGYAALVDQIQTGGGGAIPVLPDGGVEIEYIGANGTQYINSQYYPNNTTRIEAKSMYTHTGTMNGTDFMHYAYGVRETIGSDTYNCDFLCNYYRYGSTDSYTNAINFGKNLGGEYYNSNFRSVAIETVNNITGGYINGTKRFSSRDTSQFQLTQPMFILWCNVNGEGQSGRPPYGRIYYLRVYESGVLLHNYIPVRIGQVGYLYDRVSGTLFSNAGTGSFILGPDIT